MKRIATLLACVAVVATGVQAHPFVSFTGTQQPAQATERPVPPRVKAHMERIERIEAHRPAVAQHRARTAQQAVAAPFVSPFDSNTQFNDHWTVIDNNNDQYTWEYNFDDYFAGEGVAFCMYSFYDASDDYLVTAQPVSLTAGNAYIAFEYASAYDYDTSERLEVLYGTCADPSQMQTVTTIEFSNDRVLTLTQLPITLPQDGDYYFAFHAISDAFQCGIIIDNVEINNGTFTGTPDLAVTAVTLPASSPVLTANEAVQVTVANNGTAAIQSFSLTMSVACNETTQTTEPQTFDVPLAVDGSTTVTLAAPADFSAEGLYTVTVTATDVVPQGDANAENNTANNSAQATTRHMGVTDVPFSSNFTDGEQPHQWSSDGSWYYSGSFMGMFCNEPGALMSMGVNLEAGKTYRVSYVYMAGYVINGWFNYTEDFDVQCGPAGGAMTTIQTVTEANTNDLYITGEAVYRPTSSGVYQFAFYQAHPQGTMYVQQVSITEVATYDISMGAISVMPTLLPVAHAGSVTTHVTVSNRGIESIEGTINATAGEAIVGSAAIAQLAAGATATIPVTYSLASLPAGTVTTVTFEALITGQEDTIADNTASYTTTITTDELGYDHTGEGDYIYDNAIGVQGGGSFVAGVPMHLSIDDRLTGFSIGWLPHTEGTTPLLGQDITLSVYSYDPAEVIVENGYTYYQLGEPIISSEAYQGTAGGQVRYMVPPTALPVGDYMVCVGASDFCLISDRVTPGQLYILMNGYAVDQVNAALGTPAIRAIFSDDEGVAHDLTVNAITSPTGNAVMSAAESITVSVTNNGSTAANGLLEVTVNGTALPSQAVTQAPYTTATYTFTADLSTPGEYTIVATATQEGDANPADNTTQAVVTCDEILDPYTMNFEGCANFATDQFNPQWSTYDGDGERVGTFYGYSYPMPADYCVAFMAFNPTATTPSMASDYYIQPYEGERMGVAFGTESGTNDDWLVSPLLRMPETGADIALRVRAYDDSDDLYPETYSVCVSTTGGNPADGTFTAIHTGEAYDDYWQAVNVDLAAYNGQEIYIAIRRTDGYIFMVDDINVAKPQGGIAHSTVATRVALYPNPATDMLMLTAACPITAVEIYTAQGALVSKVAGNGHEMRCNVAHLAPGAYIVRIATPAGTQAVKFMKK